LRICAVITGCGNVVVNPVAFAIGGYLPIGFQASEARVMDWIELAG